jgi:hypothetical protein
MVSNEAMFNVWREFYGRLETVSDFFLKRSPPQSGWLVLKKIGSYSRQEDRSEPAQATGMYTLP